MLAQFGAGSENWVVYRECTEDSHREMPRRGPAARLGKTNLGKLIALTWVYGVSALSNGHKASKVQRTLLTGLPYLAEVVANLVAHRHGKDLAEQLDTESSRWTTRVEEAKIEEI